MRRSTFYRDAARWGLGLAALAAALIASACGEVNFNPTAPSWGPRPGGAGMRHLQITGSLTAELGSCVEARILFDGNALPDSTVVCPDAPGCATLDLRASTTSTSGRHTLSFQVLRQSLDPTVYVAEVTVTVTREGLDFVLPISPAPIRAALRPGESVDFELIFVD